MFGSAPEGSLLAQINQISEYLLNLNLQISLSSRGAGAGYYRFGTEWNYPRANVPYNRLYLMDSGYAQVTCRGRKYALVPGKAYLLPSYTDIALHCPEKMTQWRTHFHLRIFGGIDLLEFATLPKWELDAPPGYRETFEKLISTMPPKTVRDIVLALKYLTNLLDPFLEGMDVQSLIRHINEKIVFEPVLNLIELKLNSPITLSEMADTMGYCPDHFSKLFSKTFNCTPYHFLLRRRLDLAKHLLETTLLSIKEISVRSGFSDPFYFSRIFKKIERCTPSEYRERFSLCS